ncbi:hypothetical protein ACFY2M_36310 [Streptomyces sp. NPDC001276]|uniref:hypothetical protein n=2 Tax=unclassified Streptomyces TaxID=2593676 RepID=UPI003688AE24
MIWMSKKTLYRHFPDSRSLLAAVLDRQFAAVERTLVAAAEGAEGQRARASARLSSRRGGVMRCCASTWSSVRMRWSTGGRDGHRQGMLSAPPELLSEITRGALERLLNSQLPHELDWTAADLLRATVDTVLHGAIRSADPGTHGEGLRAVIPTARDDEQEVGP